jgi:thiamine-phosphate pyrophosphorylase
VTATSSVEQHDRAPVVVFITDQSVDLEHTLGIVRTAAQALGPRRLLVQLRDKENGPVVIRNAATALRAVTRSVDALFVVNGATTIAHEVGADGVHMPWDRGGALGARIAAARRLLGEHIIVTAAVHDDEEVQAAIEGGATGVLVSPIYAVPGKGDARGVSAIASAVSLSRAVEGARGPRVYALGGVTAANAAECRDAGADGVAVIRALYDARARGEDVGAAALALAAAFSRG